MAKGITKVLLGLLLGLCACNAPTPQQAADAPSTSEENPSARDTVLTRDSIVSTLEDPTLADTDTTALPPLPPDLHDQLEHRIIAAGLVRVRDVDSTIVEELRYSTTNNFLGIDLYGEFNSAYLQPDVAEKLKLASLFLRSKYPHYSIVIYDAVRPRSIQQRMWDHLDMPYSEKGQYVSNPKYGSLHNFGAAVDVTILDQFGDPLDMGTEYDHFGELAYPIKEAELLEAGKLNEQQVNNRQLLRSVMYKAGFFNIQTEWWHFNSCYRKEARERYTLVE